MARPIPPSKRQKTSSGGRIHTQIDENELKVLAEENWSCEGRVGFSSELVSRIYDSELKGGSGRMPKPQRMTTLEISQYLERYLWPNFDASTSTDEHVLSIVAMINQKFSERANPWLHLQQDQDMFTAFFRRVLSLDIASLSASETTSYVVFLIHCFQSLENEMLRSHMLKLVSLPLWHNLSPGRLKLELKDRPSLMKRWNKLVKKEAKEKATSVTESSKPKPEVVYLVSLIDVFLKQLEKDRTAEEGGATSDPAEITFCERFLEFLADLLSQLPTRRFVRILLQEKGILAKCRLSPLYSAPDASLFQKLVLFFAFYMDFNIDDHSGEPYSEEEYQARHYERLTQLQRLMFKYWDASLHEFAMVDCATLQKRSTLIKALDALSEEELQKMIVTQLKLASEEDTPWMQRPEFLREVFLSYYEKRELQREQVTSMALFPTEDHLWDPNKIPSPQYAGETCLPVPKLNLQFLSLHDYLMRNFEIYRLEAAYEIQEDIGDVLGRVGATTDDDGKIVFKGWARMGSPVTNVKVIEVQKPMIGQEKPAAVKAEVAFTTKFMRRDVKAEWDTLKQYDVVFLITLKPNKEKHQDEEYLSPRELYGVEHVRGCEIIEVRDGEGKLMNDFSGGVRYEEKRDPVGFERTLVISLDPAQYQSDVSKSPELYDSFCLLVRRRPKENNFKAVLECTRDVMNERPVELDWIQDVFLGYGYPNAAHYTQLPTGHVLELDMKDTFLDLQHVKESFADYTIETESVEISPPFKITFSVLPGVEAEEGKVLTVESYNLPNRGPFPQDQPAVNDVRFTPVQVEAVMTGMQKGLSLVVGPPGTGKTDTAVQILHLLYHNFPNQRTLLITHSNHALNDLFQKLMERDVPARYLLRLGMGEQELETDLDFSRAGRVNAMLARRLELLQEVQKLARQFSVSEDLAYSCETAGHFWMLHVLSRWEKFTTQCQASQSKDCVQDYFPFTEYFANAPQPLFRKDSFQEDMEIATGCFRHLKTVFQELEECRAFELLKSQSDRVNYLLTKQAKIVAMTCTHAALKRRDFLKIGFQYDSVLMEESAQALEIETFIPWTLQKCETGVPRLKRIVLIGDHHQLPPVVKHPAFQKYSQMDQSLFSRFIRLGVPYMELDAQGRSRTSIAKLFNWRYKILGDLPCIASEPIYLTANAGFAWEYQFVDVQDPDGVGESVPTPFFYQNLAEAEYVVLVYQFMRLLGYPASKISILTTYNGQKHLLRDVLAKKCTTHPAFGNPHKVTTVDKFQGQQNDYILLSLVRTRAVGHIRDVRRLVVAMSRARLGLYIFGSGALFRNCFEMQPVVGQWSERSMQLSLVKGEAYGHCTRKLEDPTDTTVITGLEEMDVLVQQMTAEWEAHTARQATEIELAVSLDSAPDETTTAPSDVKPSELR